MFSRWRAAADASNKYRPLCHRHCATLHQIGRSRIAEPGTSWRLCQKMQGPLADDAAGAGAVASASAGARYTPVGVASLMLAAQPDEKRRSPPLGHRAWR